jgi:regulator of sirC expression with transglutaminase-like and TPR domain
MDADLEAGLRALAGGVPRGELEAALLVARWLDPVFSLEKIGAQLTGLAERCGTALPWEFLGGLGFAGDADRYDAPENSHIARVLERHTGIPISLAIVLIEVARRAGHTAIGLNFPGHFLVRVDDTLVDPFSMRPIDAAAAVAGLPEAHRHRTAAELFASADAPTIAFRMLTNLKNTFLRRSALHWAVEALDGQIALMPDYPTMYVERGDLWLRLGDRSSARTDFETGLAKAEDLNATALVIELKNRLTGFPGEPTIVH